MRYPVTGSVQRGAFLALEGTASFAALENYAVVAEASSAMERRDGLIRNLRDQGVLGVVACEIQPRFKRSCLVHGLLAVHCLNVPDDPGAVLDTNRWVIQCTDGTAIPVEPSTEWEQKSASMGGLLNVYRSKKEKSLRAEQKAEIEKQFGRAADLYAVSEHRSGKDLDLMIEFAQPHGDESVLDIATGAGHTALAFAPHVKKVVVTDLVDKMVNKSREQFAAAEVANAEFKVADAEDLPFGDAEFDIVTCRIAPHHFSDIRIALREVFRVLVPGGRFVVVDSTEPGTPGAVEFLHRVEVLRDPTHVRSYAEAEWREFLHATGFLVERVALQRKRRAFDFWLDRGGAEGETRTELSRLFREASSDVQGELEIEHDESGQVVAFSDDKVVIAALKPEG